MSLAEDIYGPENADVAPPEAARWAFFLDRGVTPVCTLVRRRDGATWADPRIVVAYPGAEPAVPPDPVVPWDARLEDWLIAHRVRAASPENEVERFGFDLVARFAVIEKRCTTAPFTQALLRFLYDTDCKLYVPLEKRLGAIRTYEPDPAAAKTETCSGIGNVMKDVDQAIASLGYDDDARAKIRGDALAYFLRDRFGIDQAGTVETPPGNG